MGRPVAVTKVLTAEGDALLYTRALPVVIHVPERLEVRVVGGDGELCRVGKIERCKRLDVIQVPSLAAPIGPRHALRKEGFDVGSELLDRATKRSYSRGRLGLRAQAVADAGAKAPPQSVSEALSTKPGRAFPVIFVAANPVLGLPISKGVRIFDLVRAVMRPFLFYVLSAVFLIRLALLRPLLIRHVRNQERRAPFSVMFSVVFQIVGSVSFLKPSLVFVFSVIAALLFSILSTLDVFFGFSQLRRILTAECYHNSDSGRLQWVVQ